MPVRSCSQVLASPLSTLYSKEGSTTYLGCGLCMLRVQVFTSLLTLRMTSKTTHFPTAFYFQSSLSPAVCVGGELGFMGLLNTFLSGRSCRDRVKITTSKWSQLLFLPCPSPFPQNEALRSFTGLYQIFRGRCYTRRREPHGTRGEDTIISGFLFF